jgi:hypothetical protein
MAFSRDWAPRVGATAGARLPSAAISSHSRYVETDYISVDIDVSKRGSARPPSLTIRDGRCRRESVDGTELPARLAKGRCGLPKQVALEKFAAEGGHCVAFVRGLDPLGNDEHAHVVTESGE